MPIMNIRIKLLSTVLCLALFLTGCAPLQPTREPQRKPDAQELQQQADQAWQEERLQEAMELYQELLQLEVPDQVKLQAWQRLARAALETDQLQVAGSALRNWADLDPAARESWEWNSLLIDYLQQRGQTEQMEDRLRQLLDVDDFTVRIQKQALDRLSRYYLSQDRHESLWSAWKEAYAQLDEDQARMQMEQDLRSLLQELEPELWSELEPEIMQMDQAKFPGGLLQWEYYLQGLRQDRLPWLQVGPALQGILSQSKLQLASELLKELQDLESELGPARLGVVLLLPLDGDFRDISRSIVAGVDAALWQLRDKSPELEVKVVNTSSQGWFQELKRLPDRFKLVGGPLQGSIWQELAESQQPRERIFFAFRPSLGQGQEGSLGYRFFPGPKDQVQALLQVMQEEIGIQSYGIFYPQGDYGKRMSRNFWEEVQDRGAEINALASYSPREHSSWRQGVADFLQVPKELRGPGKDREQKDMALVSPMTQFRAVFLPDSLKRARMMIPEFFYYDARSLIFLGPALWSQDRTNITRFDRDFFGLAVMPGAWLPGNENPAQSSLQDTLQELLQGEADFWSGLGYDFLRFVHRLPLDLEPGQRESLNAYLAKDQDFSWSMAPLSWDSQGRASQDLYLLQPGHGGPEPLDVSNLRSRWQLQRTLELRRRARYIDREALQ
ncbi:MAG: penicillin-binding protein activator [Desulfohalobiaceae bacterium]